MLQTHSRQNALLALLLSVPAASLGVAMLLYIAPLGQILSLLCYLWLLALPLAWFFWSDRGKLRVSLPKGRELLAGTLLGVLMFSAILGAYWFFGQHWIDVIDFREKVKEVGITTPNIYVVSATYSVLINSLLEEYVWRWFVCSQCKILVSGTESILLSALFFTLHHVIGLAAYTHDWRIVLVGSLGVFIAGTVWSWCYLTSRSLWLSYISHALADLALAFLGWHLLFQ